MSTPIPPFNPPFTPPVLTLPIPFGPQNPGTGFSQLEIQVLAPIADGIGTSIGTSVLQTGAKDLFQTEQSLQSLGLSLNQFVGDLQTLDSLLKVSGAAATLKSLLANPETFLNPIILQGLQDTSPAGLPSVLFSATGGIPIGITVTSGGVFNISGKQGLGSGLGAATSASASGPSALGSSSTTFPVTFRPFVDALFGQSPTSPPSNDVFSGFQALYNFYLQGGTGLNTGSIAALINAFNQQGLLSNSVNLTSLPWAFPVVAGDSTATFITSLLNFTTNPAAAIAEVLMTPPPGASNAIPQSSVLSVSSAVYSFLNSQSGGPLGATAQSFTRPLINSLFGVSPTSGPGTNIPGTTIPNDPYDILTNFLISKGPVSFLVSLFPSTNIPGTTPTLSVSGLANDLFFNPSNIPSDFLNIISPKFTTFFQGLFTQPVNYTGAPSIGGWVSDLFNSPSKVVSDFLNLINVSGFSNISNAVTQALGLGQFLNSLISNIGAMDQRAFVGFPQSNLIAFGDSVKAGAAGYTSTAPFGIPNNTFAGNLGFALMCAATAANEGDLLIKSLGTGGTSIPTAAADIQRFLSMPIFLSAAVVVVVQYLAQVMAAISNIANILNFSSIPQTPSSLGNGFIPFNLSTAGVGNL